MKIAVFSDSYRPYTSGVVRSIDTFGAQWIKQGHQVYLFAPRYYRAVVGPKGASTGDQSMANESITRIFRFWSIPMPTAGGFHVALPLSFRLGRVLQRLGIDVVHSHSPFSMGQLAAFAARHIGVPLIFTHHTMYHEYVHYVPGAQLLWGNATLRYVGAYCRKADVVIAPTPDVGRFIAEKYRIAPERVRAIPTGIALEEYVCDDRGWLRRRIPELGDDPVLLSVGRLCREKNAAFLVDAFAQLRRYGVQARLVFVGDGPDRERLAEKARAMQVADRVHFAGLLSKPEVIRAYHGADLFVIASTTETQGLVTLEAMAAGLPVVGVDATGTRDMVEDGVQGSLVPLDPERFASCVARYLSDPALRRHTARKALERASALSANKTAMELQKVYRELCQARTHVKAARRVSRWRRPTGTMGTG